MKLAYLLTLAFCTPSAFAFGPIGSGGPAPVKAIINCSQGDEVAFHVNFPGNSAFYAKQPVFANLRCNEADPIVCEGRGNDGIAYRVEVGEIHGKLKAKIFTDSGVPDDVIDCNRME